MNFDMLIDLHTHIIPYVDDGSRSIAESLELIKSAYSQGITCIVATPHYSRRGTVEGIEKIRHNYLALVDKAKEEIPDVQIILGQELRSHEELADNLKSGKALTINNTRYVLVEFEPSDGYEVIFGGLRRLIDSGYIPIVAHVERYACLDTKRIREIRSLGCLIQMNYDSLYKGGFLSSITERFDSELRRCRDLVLSGFIDIMGSDMHRTDFRPPHITPAVRWLRDNVSESYFEKLTYGNAHRVLFES